KAFGSVGGYECITGKVHFAIDPTLGPNRIIADVDLAPKDSGLVQFSADYYILRPREPAKGNGTALVEISNRGGKSLAYEFDFARGHFDPQSSDALGDDFLLEHGFTLVWIGWEFDVPARPGLLRAYLPVATDDGKSITGMVRSEWTGDTLEQTIPLGDKGQTGYPVLDPASSNNKLFVRDTVLGQRTLIPHSKWKFIDATHVSLEGGFVPGRIYEVVYEVKDPPVAGLRVAAVRDCVSYMKYREHDGVQRAIGFGVSQSGRFLREFLYDGFNQDETNRKVFDGVWAHVAGAGRGSFNHRFAQPSRDGHEFMNWFYPTDIFPFTDLPETDPESGVTAGLLDRARAAHVVPKIFYTNGSYEYWGRAA